MNTCDCQVTKILGAPFEKHKVWWLEVEANCYGRLEEHVLMFKTEKEALDIKIGHVFAA